MANTKFFSTRQSAVFGNISVPQASVPACPPRCPDGCCEADQMLEKRPYNELGYIMGRRKMLREVKFFGKATF